MKKSNLTFAEGFMGIQSQAAIAKGNSQMYFDWDLAAQKIKEYLVQYPDLIAEAGLQGDWNYTGGVIFQDGKPDMDSYTYLSSNWATPTLILSTSKWQEIVELECYTTDKEKGFESDTKWPESALKIINDTEKDEEE